MRKNGQTVKIEPPTAINKQNNSIYMVVVFLNTTI